MLTQEQIDKQYRKGIITAWEHELATLRLQGKLTQEEVSRLLDLIYADIKERFDPKP